MDGAVKRFKGGIFLLAIENGLPVVPVSVAGSRIVMPKGRFMVCRATVDVTVHDADSRRRGCTRDDARALAERVRRPSSPAPCPEATLMLTTHPELAGIVRPGVVRRPSR